MHNKFIGSLTIAFCFFISGSLTAQLIFTESPENFKPRLEVAGCFVMVHDEALFLKRQENISEGGLWGLPGGKLEKGEDAVSAIHREVFEETGLVLEQPFIYLGKVYVRFPKVDFIYHMFEARLIDYPTDIVLSPKEHSEYWWMTLEEALEVPMVPGCDECFELIYGVKRP